MIARPKQNMWTLIEDKRNQPFQVTDRQWPVWLHGSPKSGASFATVLLAASYIRQGERMVFLCAHGEAIRALQSQLELPKPEVKAKDMDTASQQHIQDMQLITLRQEKGKNFSATLQSLPDLEDRIIIIKNIEETLTPELVEIIGRAKRVLLSGDFSKHNSSLVPSKNTTRICFSEPPVSWGINYEALPTYIGQYWKNGRHGQLFAQEQAAIDKY